MPRDIPTIEAAFKRLTADRAAKVAARNRRDADMLRALADVEQYETEIRAVDSALDGLLDERDRVVHPERYTPDALTEPAG